MYFAIISLAILASGDTGLPQHSSAWPDTPARLGRADQEAADFAIEAMITSLQKIRSGEVLLSSQVNPPARTYANDNWLLFDHAQGLQRFDQRSGLGTQYIRTPDDVITHLPREASGGAKGKVPNSAKVPGYVTVDAANNDTDIPGAMPIDVRIAGIGDFAKFRNNWTLENFLEEYANKGTFYPGTLSYFGEVDGAYKELVWISKISKGRPTKIVLRLDSTREMVPVLQMMFVEGKNGNFELVSLNQAEWIQKDGIWIPVHWKMNFLIANISHDLHLNWEMVNRPVNKEEFTVNAFDLPKGTTVVNARIKDEVLVERVVGEDSPPDVSTSPFLLRWLVLSVNVVVLVGVAVAFIWKRQGK